MPLRYFTRPAQQVTVQFRIVLAGRVVVIPDELPAQRKPE
jgi:hypothetical protein